MEGRYFIHWTSQNRIPNAVSWSGLLVCSFASTLACLYLWQFVAFGETGRQAQSNLKVNWLSVAQDCRKRYCSCLRVFFVSFYSIDNLCVPQMPTYVVSEKQKSLRLWIMQSFLRTQLGRFLCEGANGNLGYSDVCFSLEQCIQPSNTQQTHTGSLMHRHMHSHTPQLQTSQQSCPCCSNFAIAQNIAEPPRGCGPAANQFPTNNNDPQRKIQNRKQLIKTCFISVFLYNERPLVFLSVYWGRLKKGAAPERKRESLTVIDTGPRYAACWWTFINGATARLENTAHTHVHTHTHTCTDLMSNTWVQPQLLHVHTHTHEISGFMEDCRFILPLTVFSEKLSDCNSLSKTHTRTNRQRVYFTCSSLQRGARCTSTCQPPLWAIWGAVHQDVSSCGGGVRGRDQTRGVITCYLSITAQVSEIDHSVQAAWGVPLGAQHNKSGDQPGE